jgi:hypothetical protein
MTGAQFEILVDGKPRSYRDTKSGAMDAATFLKARQPHSEVAVTSGTATQTDIFNTGAMG